MKVEPDQEGRIVCLASSVKVMGVREKRAVAGCAFLTLIRCESIGLPMCTTRVRNISTPTSERSSAKVHVSFLTHPASILHMVLCFFSVMDTVSTFHPRNFARVAGLS